MEDLMFILMDGINFAAWLFLAAVGLTLIYGVMKILNVAHGSFYAMGAYVAASTLGFWFDNSMPPYLSYVALLVAAFVAGFIVGPIIERVLLKPQYDRDEHLILLITYGLFLILEDILKLIWGVDPYFVSQPYELVDNLAKAVLDALQEVMGDDTNVSRLVVEKSWGPEGRTTVRVT